MKKIFDYDLPNTNIKKLTLLTVVIEILIISVYVVILLILHSIELESLQIGIFFVMNTFLALYSQFLLNKYIIIKHYFPLRLKRISDDTDEFFTSLTNILSEASIPYNSSFKKRNIVIHYNEGPIHEILESDLGANTIEVFVYSSQSKIEVGKFNLHIYKDNYIYYRYNIKQLNKLNFGVALHYQMNKFVEDLFVKILSTNNDKIA